MLQKKNEHRSSAPAHLVHDVGGLDFGNIDMQEHDLAFWERRVDAMLEDVREGRADADEDVPQLLWLRLGAEPKSAGVYAEGWLECHGVFRETLKISASS